MTPIYDQLAAERGLMRVPRLIGEVAGPRLEFTTDEFLPPLVTTEEA